MQMNLNINEKSSQSQNQLILQHLLSGKRITALEALEQYRCLRLSARILDLKNQGYAIESEFVSVPSGKKVKAYFMDVEVAE